MARYSRNDQAGVELPKARLDRESLKQAVELFRYLRPYRARFSVAMVALFASSLLSLSFPLPLAGPKEEMIETNFRTPSLPCDGAFVSLTPILT